MTEPTPTSYRYGEWRHDPGGRTMSRTVSWYDETTGAYLQDIEQTLRPPWDVPRRDDWQLPDAAP